LEAERGAGCFKAERKRVLLLEVAAERDFVRECRWVWRVEVGKGVGM